MRDDLPEWDLYRAILGAKSAAGIGDSDISGRPYEIRDGVGDDCPTCFCDDFTADGATAYRRPSAVHGNGH